MAGTAPKIDMLKRMQRALREGGDCYSLPDIVAAIEAGKMQVLTKDDAFVLTEIAVLPRKKFLNVVALCGRLDAVMSLHADLEAFAREHGCAFILSVGRPGWTKVLPAYGWERTGVVHVFDLGGYRG